MELVAAWRGRTVGVDQWHRSTTQYDPKRRKHFSRIYVSPAYHRFMEDMAICFKRAAQKQGWPLGYTGYVDIEIEAWLWKVKDSDGIEKPLCDALQLSGVVENDRQIRHKLLLRHYHRKQQQDLIIVTVMPVPQQQLAEIEREQKEGYTEV